MTRTVPVARLDALTGLRFIAALAVFVHHAQALFPSGVGKLGPLGGGAVSFFFVLSGFILTHVYGEHLERGSLRAFYAARLARIWPVHLASLMLLFLLFGSGPLADGSARFLLVRHTLLLQAWDVDLAHAMGFNGVAWSISVEAFFYAGFPFFCRLSTRGLRRALAVVGLGTVGALVALELLALRHPEVSDEVSAVLHVLPPLRLCEFLTGIATARWLKSRASASAPRSFVQDTCTELALLALVVGSYLALTQTRWLSEFSGALGAAHLSSYLVHGPAFAPVFALTVAGFAYSRGAFARACGSRGAVFLGEVSFSFYMVHSLMLRLVRSWPEAEPLASAATALALSLAAGVLMHFIVELPLRDMLARVLRGEPRSAWMERLVLPRRALELAALGLALATFAFAPTLHSVFAWRHVRWLAEREIERTPERLRDVRFEGEARVLGAGARLAGERLEVTVVFERLEHASRRLFVHVCAADGTVLRQPALTTTPFASNSGAKLELARASLSKDEFAGAALIGIGFWNAESGSVAADHGPRSMGGHRLDILRLGKRRAGDEE